VQISLHSDEAGQTSSVAGRSTIRIVGAVAAVGIAIAACTQDGDAADDSDASASSAPSAIAELPPDAEVLQAYVEAMAAGDVDSAIGLRCEQNRPSGENADVFQSNLERLRRSLGEVRVDRIVEIDPPTGLLATGVEANDPSQAGWREELHAVELNYWLSVDGETADAPLITVVIDQDGARRLCGEATHLTQELYLRTGSEVGSLGLLASDDLSALMPPTVGDGYQQVEDREFEPSDTPGGVGGWTRAWQEASFGGMRVTATMFDSAETARLGVQNRIRVFAPGAIDEFEVPELDGALGLRVSSFSWLGVHPPGWGPLQEVVFLRFGNAVVEVNVTVAEAATGDRRAVEVARDVTHRALRQPS
jgi:hypothetical protein